MGAISIANSKMGKRQKVRRMFSSNWITAAELYQRNALVRFEIGCLEEEYCSLDSPRTGDRITYKYRQRAAPDDKGMYPKKGLDARPP
jgi:hypothetical protein